MCIFCSSLAAGGDSNAAGGDVFRYRPADFVDLPLKPLHLDLCLDFAPKNVEVTTIGTYLYTQCLDKEDVIPQPLNQIKLDQNKLDIKTVAVIIQNAENTTFKSAGLDLRKNDWVAHIDQFDTTPTTLDEEQVYDGKDKVQFMNITDFVVDAYEQKLIINLPQGVVIQPNTQFIVKTLTVATPNDYDLEGIYLDYTPVAEIPTFISQCQQFGFRKIAPTIDQMTSKCSFTTTIIADGRYSSAISGGDFTWFKTNPITQLIEPVYRLPSSKFPIDADESSPRGAFQSRRVLRYQLNDPIATYLFFCGVGTYTTYSRDVETPLHHDDAINVQRRAEGKEDAKFTTYRIDLVSFPDAFKPSNCVEALQVLHEASQWLAMMGPSKVTTAFENRRKLLALTKERELIKDSIGAGRYGVYATLKHLADDTQEYPQQLTTALKSQNPCIAEYRSKNGAETGTHPVSHYDVDAFPIWCGVHKVVAEKRLAEIRDEMFTLYNTFKIDEVFYRFNFQIYREIGMQRSQYGGMENAQCTTILSSRLVPQSLLTDGAFQYLVGVKIHELYHWTNGSKITGSSPFDIWLNECVTVHIQRFYEHEVFGFDTMRTSQVKYAFAPGSGPLAVDSLPNAMAVIPEGFNDTTELISAATYSKSPEVSKIYERLMGTPKFNEALRLYYSRFEYGNATTPDWIQAMVDVSKDEGFAPIADKWLKETGYPTLAYYGEYDPEKAQYRLTLKQTGWEKHQKYPGPWRFGVEVELFGAGGNKLIPQEQKKHSSCQFIDSQLGEVFLHDFKLAEETIIFDNITEAPLFPSVARHWSFFGVSKNAQPDETQRQAELLAQIKFDDDGINKMFAWNTVKEAEVARLSQLFANAMNNDNNNKLTVDVDEGWLKSHAAILFNADLSTFARGAILDESLETCADERVAHEYFATSNAITALFQGLWGKYNQEIIALYQTVNTREQRQWPLTNGFNQRPLKKHLLSIMKEGLLKQCIVNNISYNNDDIILKSNLNLFNLSKELLFESEIMTDKLFGLKLAFDLISTVYDINPNNTTDFELIQHDTPFDDHNIPSCAHFNNTTVLNNLCCNQLTQEEVLGFLKQVDIIFKAHPDALEQYIMVISSLTTPYSNNYIERMLNSPYFSWTNPAHSRTFCRAFAMQKGKALLTDSGLAMVKKYMYKVALLNQMTATAFIQLFGDILKFDTKRQAKFVAVLKELLDKFDPVEHVSTVNNIKRILSAVEKQQQ